MDPTHLEGGAPAQKGRADRLGDAPWAPSTLKNIQFGAVLFLVLAAAWAWWRESAVFDDAYISYRYAMNLVAGQGLTFSPGMAVEGYSNLAWVLWAALGIALGLDPLAFTRGLGVGAYLASVAWLVHSFTPRLMGLARRRVLALPFFFIMISPPGLATISGSGLETAFAGALILGIGLIEFAGRPRSSAPKIFGAASILAALFCLTRPEGPLASAALAFAVLFTARSQDRPLETALAWAARSIALPFAAYALQGIFRLFYYGQLLPNPYYAKGADGGQWEAGLAYVGAFVWSNPVALVLLGLIAFGFWRGNQQDRGALAYVGCFGALYLFYVLRVGGDFMQFRFMWQAWPVLVMGACIGLSCLLNRSPPTGIAVALLALPLLAGDVRLERRFHMQSIDEMQSVTDTGWLVAPVLAEALPRDTVIATTMIGVIGYGSGLDVVDQWGLTEPYVHDAPQREPFQRGHQKPAPTEYLEAREVNLYFDHPRICRCDGPCPMFEPTILIRLDKNLCVASWLMGPTPKLTRHICDHPVRFISRPSICDGQDAEERSNGDS